MLFASYTAKTDLVIITKKICYCNALKTTDNSYVDTTEIIYCY